jgi:hypothetical protein
MPVVKLKRLVLGSSRRRGQIKGKVKIASRKAAKIGKKKQNK